MASVAVSFVVVLFCFGVFNVLLRSFFFLFFFLIDYLMLSPLQSNFYLSIHWLAFSCWCGVKQLLTHSVCCLCG